MNVLKQGSLEVENFTQNGTTRTVHYIIKNAPYCMELGLTGTNAAQSIDFRRLTMSATLLYDSADEKEVSLLRVVPLQFRGNVNSANALRYQVEFSVCILSSHHEDMNFRVRFNATDGTNKYALVATSEPMCVISKPEVLDKKKHPQKRKRTTVNDSILEALGRIEENQLRFLNSPPASPSSNGTSFQESFVAALLSYHNSDNDERKAKIVRTSEMLTDDQIPMTLYFLDALRENLIRRTQDCSSSSSTSPSSSPGSPPVPMWWRELNPMTYDAAISASFMTNEPLHEYTLVQHQPVHSCSEPDALLSGIGRVPVPLPLAYHSSF
jgi:hypothetical protein